MYALFSIAVFIVAGSWTFDAFRRASKWTVAPTRSALHTPKHVHSRLAFRVPLYLTSSYAALNQLVNAWLHLLYGVQQIDRGYAEAGAKAYVVPTPDARYVFISSSEHIKEMDAAGNDTLSLHAASKQMFQPEYTMHGFNWHDQRGVEGIGFVRALRTLLTQHLPSIMPSLRNVISEELMANLAATESANGMKLLPAYPMIKKLVTKANGLAFFGAELVRNDEFMTAALDYIDQVLITAEVIRLLPKALAPTVGRFFRRYWNTQETIFGTILAIVEQRQEMQLLENDGSMQKNKPNDCVQWIIDTAPKKQQWSAERIVYEIMAIWFGSVHALSMTITYGLYDTCLHPEYVPALRDELAGSGLAEFYATGQGLPLLDSFIKESARLTPVEAMTSRRTALRPFTFSSGPTLKPGDWATIPVRAILHDERYYPSPHTFHGFRFVDQATLQRVTKQQLTGEVTQPEGPSKVTDIGGNYHVWGTGKMTCAGRFYVAVTIKLILSQILTEYNVELVDEKAMRTRTWRSTIIPRSDIMVAFTPRLTDDG